MTQRQFIFQPYKDDRMNYKSFITMKGRNKKMRQLIIIHTLYMVMVYSHTRHELKKMLPFVVK